MTVSMINDVICDIWRHNDTNPSKSTPFLARAAVHMVFSSLSGVRRQSVSSWEFSQWGQRAPLAWPNRRSKFAISSFSAFQYYRQQQSCHSKFFAAFSSFFSTPRRPFSSLQKITSWLQIAQIWRLQTVPERWAFFLSSFSFWLVVAVPRFDPRLEFLSSPS